MQIIKRKMETEIINSQESVRCQASFNSDCCITLRNYDPIAKDKDEIIILSYGETQAILSLFHKMKTDFTDLPF